MKAAISLTDNGSRNFHHALICARRMSENDDIDDVVFVTRGEGVELFDSGLESSAHEELVELLDSDVTFKVSQPCVDSREMGLVDGVESIPSGAIDLLELQNESYELIKVP